MSKSPGGITKDKRKRTLLEILNRWGKLNFEQLSQHIESALGIDVTSARRTLYRDLEELVSEGILTESRFSPDGSEITAYDQELHKNTVCHWSIANQENSTLGARILENHGGQVLTSQRIKQHVRLILGKPGGDPLNNNKMGLYFSLGNDFVALELTKSHFPYTLLFSRTPNPTEPPVDLATLEQSLGKRLILLSLPIPSISTIKKTEKLGHCHLSIETETHFLIEDHHSTNGTKVAPINRTLALDRIKKASVSGNSTLTSTSFESMDQQAAWIEVFPKKAISIEIPAIISVSKSFQAILI